MEGWMIVGSVIGILCIVGSFFIKEKEALSEEEKKKLTEEVRAELLSEQNMERILSDAKRNFSVQLDSLSEEQIEKMEDSMSGNANEKMIALNEMYEGLIEKIEHNHKEVVFLYDMLNQKGEELKDFSAKLDGMRKGLSEEEKKLLLTYEIIKKKMKHLRDSQGQKDNIGKKPLTKVEEEVKGKKKEGFFISEKKEEFGEEESIRAKDTIIRLHQEGKNVMEISKELSLGQGEVGLILELYAKNR